MAFEIEKKPVGKPQQVEQVLKPDICQANGCYLPAGIYMGGNWLCKYHSRQDARAWDVITRTLRMCRSEVLTLMALQKVSYVEAKAGWDMRGTDRVPAAIGDNLHEYEEKLSEFIASQISASIGERTGNRDPEPKENRLQTMLRGLNIVRRGR